MKRSVIAAVVVTALGLLSMGLLGALLYYLAAPVLWPFFGNLNDWEGDGVWPATIAAGMLWGPGFVLAGGLNRWLEQAGWPQWRRRAVYALVLWAVAVLLWCLLASSMDIRLAAAG